MRTEGPDAACACGEISRRGHVFSGLFGISLASMSVSRFDSLPYSWIIQNHVRTCARMKA